MSQEGQLLDQKSLRSVIGKSADWNELVKDCIAFANATGGRLLLGIEDGQDAPPAGQQVHADLPDTIRRKIAERSVNVAVLPDVVTAAGFYPELAIGDIRQRIGSETHPRQVKRALDGLVDKGDVRFAGDKRWRRYWAVP